MKSQGWVLVPDGPIVQLEEFFSSVLQERIRFEMSNGSLTTHELEQIIYHRRCHLILKTSLDY